MHSLLDVHDPISWKVYPPEFIISEKMEALISREGFSSRAKDIYDITLLVKKCEKLNLIKPAITATFKQRGTKISWPILPLLKDLNLENLRDSWPSVELKINLTFDQAWKAFLEGVEKIDAASSD
jgi:hypothetical protein